MARDFDDARRRMRDADALVHARRRDAEERIYVVTTNLVIDAQEKLARRRRLDRIWRAGWAVSWLSLLTAVTGTGIAALTHLGDHVGLGVPVRVHPEGRGGAFG
ncbi:hypothetical protein [Streptomyces acidicola]|uniref:hypothetical protein n=1 Tax=Streptomyces acidicola TaxID=2596892 RepID=UPI003802809D